MFRRERQRGLVAISDAGAYRLREIHSRYGMGVTASRNIDDDGAFGMSDGSPDLLLVAPDDAEARQDRHL
jgi:hypothetical protein